MICLVGKSRFFSKFLAFIFHANMNSPDIYIIIPVHNRKEFTQACLSSLRKQSYKKFRIVLIDDGSTDGTEEMIKKEFPEVIVLQGDGNLWWTGAINLGLLYVLKEARENDCILTLNNDLVVCENYLEALIMEHNKNSNALIGSLNIDIKDKKTIYDGGANINFWTAKYFHFNKGITMTHVVPINQRNISVLSGRGTLIPVNVFRKIGLYNHKKFPHYAADYEFSIRAKKHGYNLMVSYNAILFSHVKETGIGENNKRNFLKYFFDIKSPGNIFIRITFATSIIKNPILLFCYLVFDFIRTGGHYLRHTIWRSSIPTKN